MEEEAALSNACKQEKNVWWCCYDYWLNTQAKQQVTRAFLFLAISKVHYFKVHLLYTWTHTMPTGPFSTLTVLFFSCSFCPSKTYKREEIRSGHSMYLGNRCIAATNRTKTYIHKLALQEGKWPEAWTPSLHFQREQSYFPFFPGCEMTVLLLIPSGNRGFVSQLSHWL